MFAGISWEASRAPVGGSLQASWEPSGPLQGFPLGLLEGLLGVSWGFLEASWGLLGLCRGLCRVFQGLCRGIAGSLQGGFAGSLQGAVQSGKRFPEGGGSLETIKKPPRRTRKAFFHALRAKGTVADVGLFFGKPCRL